MLFLEHLKTVKYLKDRFHMKIQKLPNRILSVLIAWEYVSVCVSLKFPYMRDNIGLWQEEEALRGVC